MVTSGEHLVESNGAHCPCPSTIIRRKAVDCGPTATVLEVGTGGLQARPASGPWWSAFAPDAHRLKAGTSAIRSGEAPTGCGNGWLTKVQVTVSLELTVMFEIGLPLSQEALVRYQSGG